MTYNVFGGTLNPTLLLLLEGQGTKWLDFGDLDPNPDPEVLCGGMNFVLLDLFAFELFTSFCPAFLPACIVIFFFLVSALKSINGGTVLFLPRKN